MKILYIEDEINIAHPVQAVLKKKGFEVDLYLDGKTGLSAALGNTYDCIILDLNLPHVDGIEIARRVREQSIETPILMLTARTSLGDKLTGFESGTDDYLSKPFEIMELIARIQALIRRKSANRQIELQIGEFTLIPGKNILAKSDENISLSNKETALLEYLIRNRGTAISTEELLEHVWDSNINSFTDTVKTHVKTLRKKLGDSAHLIKTIKGKGYLYE